MHPLQKKKEEEDDDDAVTVDCEPTSPADAETETLTLFMALKGAFGGFLYKQLKQ